MGLRRVSCSCGRRFGRRVGRRVGSARPGSTGPDKACAGQAWTRPVQNWVMPAIDPRRRQILSSLAASAASAATPATWALGAPPASAAARPPWRVGPGQALTRVADALRLAGDGDTLELLPGTYAGDVAVILQRRLSIIGIGERPLIVADGQHAEGKAIWVVRDGDIRIENIAFRGARVPSGNGAGIRFERGRLQLKRCAFHDNQMGLLSGNEAGSELHISDSDFGDAPVNPGSLPHLLYVGRIGRFSLRGSRLLRGHEGHLLKSRAGESLIVGNRFDDGLQGQASYEIDLPNGGVAWVEDNTLVQSPKTQNPVMLSYGAEGQPWPQSRLTLRGNRFVDHLAAGGSFVRVWADRLPPDCQVRSVANRYLGTGQLQLGPRGESVDDRHGPAPTE
jgi:hypothetical protein